MSTKLADTVLGILVTISLGLAGWSLRSVVEIREQVGINAATAMDRKERLIKLEQFIAEMNSQLGEMKGLNSSMLRELNNIQNTLIRIEATRSMGKKD